MSDGRHGVDHRSGVVTGPVVENYGIPHQDHGQGEVAEYQPRVQVAEHHDPAKQDLGHHPGH